MSLESAIPPYEEVFLCRPTTFQSCYRVLSRALRMYAHTHTEIEGTGEAFSGAAGRIIPRPRTLRGYEEGEEVDIAPLYAPTHCRRK